LHAFAAVLVALVLRRLGVPGACLAAAIFALHPVHVESVAWITEQKNTLSAVFYLAALLVYLHFDQTRKKAWYFCALVLFVLALLSKTVTGTLPGALLVIFWWQRGRLSWTKDVLPLVPFFLLGAGGGMITAWWEVSLNRCGGSDYDQSLIERLLIAGRAVWFYLGKLFWPVKLTFIYPHWQINSAQWWQYSFLLGAVLVTAALWAIRRYTRAPLAALLFFAGTLFPMLSFFNLYAARYSFVANHYPYLASLGVVTLVAAGVALLLERWRISSRPAGYVLCALLLATLATLTWRQSRVYAGAETLYQATIAENPECWMAHLNLGAALAQRGQMDDAIAHCRQALTIKPELPEARHNLAKALAGRGQADEAIASYQQALKIRPDCGEDRRGLGDLLAARGNLDEAAGQYFALLRLNPRDVPGRTQLASVLSRQGKWQAAETHLRIALRQEPSTVGAYSALAMALQQQGKTAEALNYYQEALRLRPDQLDILNNLAWICATHRDPRLRDGAQAVSAARRAVELSAGKADVLDTLAAAYAEAGRFPEAVATARKSLSLAVQQKNQALVEALRGRIALYEAGKPYRE
jgi:tetratricopeptide (TPR) repeat protein